MRTSNIVILCCFSVVFVALGVTAKWQYFDPEPLGGKSKRVRIAGYLTAALAFAVLTIIFFYRGLAK